MISNLPNIKNQLSSKDLFDAFKMQLTKDFEHSNFPADFVAALEPNYSAILQKIASELQRDTKKSDSKIMQLLRRVDISEAQLRKYLSENSNETYFNVIAELIIKRVLQKVVIKRHYKTNEHQDG
jgi:hypothetical protein